MTQPGALFTVTTAATACGVSRKTITRRLDQLREAGAYKDGAGAWVIPLAALYSAGLSPGRPTPPDPVLASQGRDVGHQDTSPTPDVLAELAELRRRAEVAEALAAARAEQIVDLRRAVAALEAGAGQTTPPGPVQPDPPAGSVPAPQRGILGRALGSLIDRGW